MQNSSDQSIIDSHLINLYSQLSTFDQQNHNISTADSNRLKSLSDFYHYNCLQLKARYKIEEERIDRRFDLETRTTRAQFAAKKTELKGHLLDRLRRKRKLVVDEMHSIIDINSRSFDMDPLFITMQASNSLQSKAYNFRQRPDIGQQTSNMYEEEFLSTTGGILSPIPQQPPTARKRLVGAFSIFQLPKWTIKDEECEDDLKKISNIRK
ncbi:unnamed protein product [Adineta steineri]|uniref:Uncharacterized protein n=1 Tax=Adineta steineri TaxID=433720 RepID=A0A818QTB6_9BILA|nr:unnamed protein product [Adineta steineri]CAF0748875.1 unnamed protein product [Adineta steineri]CAF0754914.1 unnamed protein product [Adineta steineri]CAF0817356.1 unnamed protein product [Adineta steineri]CAF0862112.1 unnamed protein product [Adineta steineri]